MFHGHINNSFMILKQANFLKRDQEWGWRTENATKEDRLIYNATINLTFYS